MNIVNTLTLRHMKQNKRRTLVTILGVIISVAMITAVATLGMSFMDLMQRDAIQRGGNWFVCFEGVTQQQAEAILQDPNTKTSMLQQEIGFAEFPYASYEEKPYLYIEAMNDEAFAQYHVTLTSGRMPETPEEVILPDHLFAENGQVYRIGDTLTLALGERKSLKDPSLTLPKDSMYLYTDGERLEIEREASFTVVGTFAEPSFESNWAPGYTVLTVLPENTIPASGHADLSITVKKLTRGIFEEAPALAEQVGLSPDRVVFNNDLLRWHGILVNDMVNQTLYTFMGILFVIIIAGSVSLIYNAFAISVSERSRHLGMLASVGATKAQKRNSVFFEGYIIGLISIPLGILSGIGGIAVTFRILNPLMQGGLFNWYQTEGFRVVVSPLSIFGAVILSILTIFISTWIPARRASKASAIDAIRQVQDVKISRRGIKTSRLTRKVFGIEGELGLKNLRRHRGRYLATVLSLAVSVILFLSVATFSMYLNKSMALTSDGLNFQVGVMLNNPDGEYDFDSAVAMLDQMGTAKAVTEKTLLTMQRLDSRLTKAQLPEYYRDLGLTEPDGGAACQVYLYSMDADSLAAYAALAGVEPEWLSDPEKPAAILLNELEFRKNEGATFFKTPAVKARVGDTLPLYDGEEALPEIALAGITTELPMGVTNKNVSGTVLLITSQETARRYVRPEGDALTEFFLAMNSRDPMALQQELNVLRSKISNSRDMEILNIYQSFLAQKNVSMLMQVFTYGFVVLISLICLANIFNTISTGVALRRREFAMLRSVGMTQKSFRRMIAYESVFYGLKALMAGLPISFLFMVLMYRTLMVNFEFPFRVPWWAVIVVVVGVFAIVTSTMLYALGKTRDGDIVETLKQELA